MPLTDRANVKYVYQLPYSERMQLCRILDMNDKWEILGKFQIFRYFAKVTTTTLCTFIIIVWHFNSILAI